MIGQFFRRGPGQLRAETPKKGTPSRFDQPYNAVANQEKCACLNETPDKGIRCHLFLSRGTGQSSNRSANRAYC